MSHIFHYNCNIDDPICAADAQLFKYKNVILMLSNQHMLYHIPVTLLLTAKKQTDASSCVRKLMLTYLRLLVGIPNNNNSARVQPVLFPTDSTRDFKQQVYGLIHTGFFLEPFPI